MRALVALLVLLLWCADAAGEPSAQDRALAESLFREAKRLAKSGQYDEACPKFAESQRLDPQLGTLLHMAACHEKQGRTASAWAEYTEAISLAARAKQEKREAIARERAAHLETMLSRVVLEVDDPPAGLEVVLDGKPLGRATFETPFAVDPGEHRLEATAPRRGRWSRTLSVPEGPHLETVRIPPLPDAGEHHEDRAPPDAPPAESDDGQLIAGFVVGGAGLVMVAIGSAFGLVAADQAKEADEHCDGKYCSDRGLAMHEDAYDSATASTVLFLVGLAAAGAGVVLVLTAPDDETETALSLGPLLAPGGGGLRAGVRW